MTFLQAIAYFAREAVFNLFRGWKVSLLAILTIAVSLFLAGVFLLVASNLRGLVERWRGESKLVIYLETGADGEAQERLLRLIEASPWTLSIKPVSGEIARRRFREAFPSLADLLEGWDEEPLPASLEVSLDQRRLGERQTYDDWLDELRTDPAVTMIDDDRDWLRQLRAAAFVIEGLGMFLGAILLGTAVFTISSVIRLTAYLYRDEIGVMRLVGATEFFIRGPFYVEGLFQGLVGGGLAALALFGTHSFLAERRSDAVLATFLTSEFLSAGQLLLLIGLGGLAGLVGAVLSLRRESLGTAPGAAGWASE